MDIVKLFGTTDLYEILNIDRKATIYESELLSSKIQKETEV